MTLRWTSLKPTSRRSWLILVGSVLAVVVLAGALAVLTRSPAIRTSSQFVLGTPEPDAKPVRLDTELYLPASTPAPAILLAHGFGGSKADLASQATSLAKSGYVVLAYTARGFGASGGLIHLDSVNYEVADGSRLLDYLQARPEVEKSSGRPVLGVVGSSYGGALALMLGATDHRIGAVAADITWYDLGRSLFRGSSAEQPGVFKKLWAGYLFSSGFGDSATASNGTAGCGRFAPSLCALYQSAASGSTLAASARNLLAESSPDSVLSKMQAPTLLTQGEQDSLFPLSEADANARQLSQAGAPVQVRWRSGGHDAPSAGDDVAGWQKTFFNQRLRGHGTASSDFLLSEVGAGISATNGRRIDTTLKATGYPAASGLSFGATAVPLTGKAQGIEAPAGGTPASISSIPGLGDVLGAASSLSGLTGSTQLAAIPGQTARFSSMPLDASALVIGASRLSLTVTPAKTGPITLFASLHDVGPDGANTLPARLVSPISTGGRAGQPMQVPVQLPWIVAQVPAGHRLVVEVSTTDFSYALPNEPSTYQVSVSAGSALSLSSLPTAEVRSGSADGWIVLAVLVVLLCLGFGFWRLRARRPSAVDADLRDVPIVISQLEKVYSDGYRAVDGISFRVERGQVLGLLGPNGAGKTTTLRVLMGLILPTAGEIRVFGEQVVPGAAVLSRLGAFVEGPGFLPHLSGRENLRLFWAASGRAVEQAELDTVLEIAGLGTSLDRKVKTYSHGMRQRLAIAQAMLGLPEVLILDEPTNGLDPPQIAEMRVVLGRYAETGRTVIVSSHLLAEVEQTCSHVVVMHRGQLVAAGSVAEVAGTAAMQLAVDEPARAAEVLVAAGIAVQTVPARRALEDVFLDLIGERND